MDGAAREAAPALPILAPLHEPPGKQCNPLHQPESKLPERFYWDGSSWQGEGHISGPLRTVGVTRSTGSDHDVLFPVHRVDGWCRRAGVG